MTDPVTTQLEQTIDFICRRSKLKPKLGFVLGSGLSGFAKHVQIEAEFTFKELPHFAPSHVEGHPGKLLLGHLEGVPVAILAGRLHAYEGHALAQVIFPVRTLAKLGVNTLVVTNAAGGLKRTMKGGDLMIIDDHINFSGENALRGPNWEGGARFVDMTDAYDLDLSALLAKSLRKEKVRHTRGVYVGVMGPTYETAAEIRMYAKLGGSAVGMSTVADVIAARHAGVRVCGISCITNLGTGLHKTKLTHEEVKEVASRVEERFTRTLVTFTRLVKPSL